MTEAIREVKCVANRGQNYIVSFDAEGEMVSVEVVFRRGRDYGSQRRLTWHRRTGRQMPLSAKCAGNAAVRQLAANT